MVPWQERTGGKVIFSRGGVIFLFRGRNYNYRTRPRFPLMLWKPIPPVYPRLVQRAPEGLTLEEATEMRKIGRNLTPICKLGKFPSQSPFIHHFFFPKEVLCLIETDDGNQDKTVDL